MNPATSITECFISYHHLTKYYKIYLLVLQCEYLCCRECDHPVARQSDIFAMSKEGPQGNYVNPFGHVHETLTVHRVDGVTTTTPPSNDFSWFPG